MTTGVSKESRNQFRLFYKNFWSLHILFPLPSYEILQSLNRERAERVPALQGHF